MAAETAVIIGLASLTYLMSKLANDFENTKEQANKALFGLAVIFVIGLEYAGYGIAQANNLPKAVDSYLVALLITVLAFAGFIVKLFQAYREDNKEEGFGGFGNA